MAKHISQMDPKSPEARKLALMRAAKTNATARHGMGGLPKGKGHKPRPVTLPAVPWTSAPKAGDRT